MSMNAWLLLLLLLLLLRCCCCCHAAAKGAPSIVLPHQEASYVRHIALDIGGSLIKLVGLCFVWGGRGGGDSREGASRGEGGLRV